MGEYDYLYTEHGFSKEARKYIESVDDIKGYFSEDWSSYLDYGQGWHDGAATVFVFVEGRSFKVELEVDEVNSIWMDRGEKLHQIESIKEPVVTEIETPSPKERFNCSFKVDMISEEEIEFFVSSGLTLVTKE